MKMIGFPAIGCGAYGYPIEQAAQIALKTTREFLASEENDRQSNFRPLGRSERRVADYVRRL